MLSLVYFLTVMSRFYSVCLNSLLLQLTACSRVLLEKLKVAQVFQKSWLPDFMESRGLITAFTRAPHMSLSWARSIQSTVSLPHWYREATCNILRPVAESVNRLYRTKLWWVSISVNIDTNSLPAVTSLCVAVLCFASHKASSRNDLRNT